MENKIGMDSLAFLHAWHWRFFDSSPMGSRLGLIGLHCVARHSCLVYHRLHFVADNHTWLLRLLKVTYKVYMVSILWAPLPFTWWFE